MSNQERKLYDQKVYESLTDEQLEAKRERQRKYFEKHLKKGSCIHVVRDHHHPNWMSNLTDCGYIDNFQRRVWNQIKEENLCRIAYRVSPRRKVCAVWKSELYAEFCQHRFKYIDKGSEKGPRCQDVVTRV